MSKEPTAKERIISLSSTLSPAEIAEIIGTSIQYVNKVLRNDATSENRPLLTLENYVAAHRKGITKKNDLAAFFGVTRDAIYKFEHRPKNLEILDRYKRLIGIDPLKRLSKDLLEMLEVLQECEPSSQAINIIKRLIKTLSDK